MSERLAKFIARSGVCSRRAAEELIAQKRITVNGETVDSPAFNVEGNEKILLDGEKLPAVESTRLWLYYKPTGLLTTHKDTSNRPTVFDNLPAGLPRVISVGRLDLNSEGLLLLTNTSKPKNRAFVLGLCNERLSSDNSRCSFSDRNCLISDLMFSASSLLPITPQIQSSAYLTYCKRL